MGYSDGVDVNYRQYPPAAELNTAKIPRRWGFVVR